MGANFFYVRLFLVSVICLPCSLISPALSQSPGWLYHSSAAGSLPGQEFLGLLPTYHYMAQRPVTWWSSYAQGVDYSVNNVFRVEASALVELGFQIAPCPKGVSGHFISFPAGEWARNIPPGILEVDSGTGFRPLLKTELPYMLAARENGGLNVIPRQPLNSPSMQRALDLAKEYGCKVTFPGSQGCSNVTVTDLEGIRIASPAAERVSTSVRPSGSGIMILGKGTLISLPGAIGGAHVGADMAASLGLGPEYQHWTANAGGYISGTLGYWSLAPEVGLGTPSLSAVMFNPVSLYGTALVAVATSPAVRAEQWRLKSESIGYLEEAMHNKDLSWWERLGLIGLSSQIGSQLAGACGSAGGM